MKNKFMPTAVTIGLIIGICLFSFILVFINKFRTNDGLVKVDDYINNCTKIHLVVDSLSDTKFGSITGFFTKMGSLDYFTNECTFYDTNYKKYFKIEFIGGQQDAMGFDSQFMNHLHNSDKMEATVNKIELVDYTYGTKQQPVPIFKFKCKTQDAYPYCLNDFGGDSVSTVIANTDKMYRNMIAVYLTFVKSKEDFKKMFPNK